MGRLRGLRRAPIALAVALSLATSACQADPAPENAEPGQDPAADTRDPVAQQPAPDAGPPITLAFAGEVHFEQALGDIPGRRGSTLGEMSRALRGADLAMVNLESALATGGRPARKELEDPDSRYWFRSPPAALGVLRRSGVDVATMANNHGADYGAAGLRQSLRADRRSPVAVVGIGRDAQEAFRPHRVSVRGTDVAVLAADASPRESADPTWAVGSGTGIGIAAARGSRTGRLVRAVRRAARVDDLVVVYLHWGAEGDACPTGDQQRLARDLADAGADVVVGSHAHVLLGAGMLDDTYVGYGLGNFVWYHGRQAATGVLQLRVRDGRVVRDSWQPARIPPLGGRPRRVGGEARVDAVRAWRGLRGCTSLAPGPGVSSDPAPAGGPGDGSPGPGGGGSGGGSLPAYAATVRPVGPALRRQLVGSSHDPAVCPVPLSALRLATVSHVGFDGARRTGRLLVAADVVDDVVEVFRELYRARFPIRRMRLVDAYGADDQRSMAANNTSAYNCRRVAGQDTWSDHAYGRAIDINPVQNPYVTTGDVQPQAGRRFVDVDRSPGADTARGVVAARDPVARAFVSRGWAWGGAWAQPDFQHFSAPAP